MSNSYLELKGCGRIAYVLGDCVSIKNPDTGKPFPPTAQHAIREDKVAVDNLIAEIKNWYKDKSKEGNRKEKKRRKGRFGYNTKGLMANIDKTTGTTMIFGFKVRGFTAWILWRVYFLIRLPTLKKKNKSNYWLDYGFNVSTRHICDQNKYLGKKKKKKRNKTII